MRESLIQHTIIDANTIAITAKASIILDDARVDTYMAALGIHDYAFNGTHINKHLVTVTYKH